VLVFVCVGVVFVFVLVLGIYYGGFPSGHLSQAGYAIALYRFAYNVDFLSSPVLTSTLPYKPCDRFILLMN